MSTRILLADDHKIMRDGLRSLLEQQPDMQVVGEAEDGREAVRLAQELSPDVVVMDIAMPGLNGIDAARQITLETPGVKVIALSVHSDRGFVASMLGAGASAYLEKNCAFAELAHAIRAVKANRKYLSAGITGVVVGDFVHHASQPEHAVADTLTVREREVLQLLAEGKSTRETAAILCVSGKAVEATRQRIREKLGLHSIAELTKYAIQTGLISLED